MNILIYIPELNQKWGGVRQYSATLLKVINNDYQNHYFIYHDLKDSEITEAVRNIPNHTFITTGDIDQTNNKIKILFIRTINSLLRLTRVKRRFKVSDNFSSFCKKKSIQIIHCPFQFAPSTNAAKLITTLHDVQELHFPKFFSAEERAYRAQSYLDYLRRADAVIVSYDHIKKDLIEYFQVPEQKIHVILLQMDKLWFHKYSQNNCIDLPENLKSKRYLFYPANTWEHKNHIALLQATAALRNEESIKINLIFTGHITDEHGHIVIKKLEELNLQDQVSFLGIVHESLLFSLYKNALGVVVPTLYEAGSFPLMESIFLGVPVICSNVTSLPETIGDEDYIFDPKDISTIKSKLKQLWLDENFRHKSISNSLVQKQKLINTDSLNKILNAYQNVL